MTTKEYVINKLPNARAERQIKGIVKGLQEVYYLIRDDRNTMYLASGKSESNAWLNAKQKLIEMDLK